MTRRETRLLLVPERDQGEPHPGAIEPGSYTRDQVVALLREHRNDPRAIQFIADMLEQ